METFLQLLVSGLSVGSVYALVALGFVAIYRASRVFNFAQGELLAFGAYVTTALLGWGLPWGVAIPGAMAATGLLAAAIERVVLRRLVGRPVFVTIILTIFVGVLLRILIVVVWKAEMRGVPTPWNPMATVDVGGARVLVSSLAAVAAGALALGGFFLMTRFTRIGVAMRATSSDQEVAQGLGIPAGRVLGVTWFIAGALAALGGAFLGVFPGHVDANLGYVALRAFPAVIVGGLDSPLGAVVSGVALGVLELLAQGYVNPRLGEFGKGFHEVFPYVVMILFLMVRPYGLFGSRKVERL
ncbi:MAG: branched-chain amino acid ABC transporter permease [Myxococcota bacterium]|nr:branched-chain amino acid ABC transporter permease [Myxococcota bacterium]